MRIVRLATLLTTLSLWGFLVGCSGETDQSTTSIEVPDKGLASCIANALNDSEEADPRLLTRLTCQDQAVTRLEGLEQFSNLEELYLQNNLLTDLTTLAPLPSLRVISVAGNKPLISIRGIEAAPNLEEFQANKCEGLQDISSLRYLPNLKTIGAMMNSIADISALAELNQLEDIVLNYNNIASIEALRNKPQLKELQLYNNPLGSLEPLFDNSQLTLVGVAGDNPSHCDQLATLQEKLGDTAKIYPPKICGQE